MDLNKRSYYSMLGKGLIGLVGGILIFLISFSKSNNKEKFNNYKKTWITNNIRLIKSSSIESTYSLYSKKINFDSINNIQNQIINNNILIEENTNYYTYEIFNNKNKYFDYHIFSSHNYTDTFIIILDENDKIIGFSQSPASPSLSE